MPEYKHRYPTERHKDADGDQSKSGRNEGEFFAQIGECLHFPQGFDAVLDTDAYRRIK